MFRLVSLHLRTQITVLSVLFAVALGGLLGMREHADSRWVYGFAALGAGAAVYAVFLLLSLVKALKRLHACVTAASMGDLNTRLLHIRGHNEVASVQRSLNRLLDITEAFLKETENCVEAVSKGIYFRHIIQTGMPGIYGKTSAAIGQIMGLMQNKDQLYEVNLKQMTESFDRNITTFLRELAASSEVLRKTASDLMVLSTRSLMQSSDLDNSAQRSSSSVQVISSTTTELSASIQEINQQVIRSSQIAGVAVEKSQTATASITALQEGAEKIGDIVSFIREIAEQTNLLALNATIEAARAGEAGKGFAVVAAEVKGLANKTSSATSEISAYVSNVLRAITTAVGSMNDVGSSIDALNTASSTIAAAMEEQGMAIGEILRSMQDAADSVQKTTGATSGIREAAGSTDRMARVLSQASDDLSAKGDIVTGELETFLSSLKAQ